MRPVVKLRIFEKEIIKRIMRPKKITKHEYRRLIYNEIGEMITEGIVNVKKLKRIW